MRKLLEKAIVHLLNEETDKAEELFHKFVVARARQIHEDARQEDDAALDKDWSDEGEEHFSADDLDGVEGGDLEAAAGDLEAAAGDLDAAGDELDVAADDLEGDLEGDDLGDLEGSEGEGEGDVDGRLDALEDQFDDIQSHLDRLTQEFDDLMADEEEEHDALGIGDDDEEDDFGDNFDAVDDEINKKHAEDAKADDVDYGDEEEVSTDGEGDEDEDDFDDVTESIVAELEKVSIEKGDGKEAGAGKGFSQNTKSGLTGKKANIADATPVKTANSEKNDSFEREPAPAVKEPTVKGKNQRKRSTDGTAKVSKEGDGSALLNKDYAGK